VSAQSSLGDWNLVTTGVVPMVIFLIAATAELNRPPFDLVEAEQELVGGFHTEYSSIRFALFFLAEFMNTVTMSALIVTLFFGGPQPIAIGDTVLDIPLVPNGIEGTIWLLAKVLVFLYVYVWFRATLPRFRYDQLMDLGWKLLIPASLGWFMLLAAQRLARNEGWNIVVTTAVSIVVIGGCWLLLQLGLSRAAKDRAVEGSMF
jgi:NADH-quinone oxidoreductase subunit H